VPIGEWLEILSTARDFGDCGRVELTSRARPRGRADAARPSQQTKYFP
jgi:hypothetical protein